MGKDDAVKYWEIIADELSKDGWSWGCSSQIDQTGRTIFTADAHRPDGRRFLVHADEKLGAFLELQKQTAAQPPMVGKTGVASSAVTDRHRN